MLLFRKEALEAQQVSALGRILLFTPRIADVLIALVLLFTFLLLLFVIFGSYTRKATVYGELVPVSGVIMRKNCACAAGSLGKATPSFILG